LRDRDDDQLTRRCSSPATHPAAHRRHQLGGLIVAVIGRPRGGEAVAGVVIEEAERNLVERRLSSASAIIVGPRARGRRRYLQ